MATLIIATRNAHKTEEIRAILGSECSYLTLNEFPGAPAVVEDADTFEGNARKKSVELAAWLASRPEVLAAYGRSEQCAVLADDSGLEVDALGGQPGVRSARFAAAGTGNSPDAANNAKLLTLLANVPPEKRTARFRCVLALTRVVGGAPSVFASGACEGRISFAPSGKGGFGYDPLFIPNGYEQSFAELGAEIKNRLSHRAKALEQLRLTLWSAF